MKLEGFCGDHNMHIASNLHFKGLSVFFQNVCFRRGEEGLCLYKRCIASMGKQSSKSLRVFRRIDGKVILNAESLPRDNFNR